MALALTLGAVAGCALRNPRITGSGSPCSSSRQCESDEVCFLGECRGQAAALTDVFAEVRTPVDSPYGAQQRRSIDLRRSVVVDFRVYEKLTASGTVSQEQPGGIPTPLSGATIVFSPVEEIIPARAPEVSTRAATTGDFTASLAPAIWSVSVTPPAPLPPWRASQPLAQSGAGLQLRLPAAADLVRVQVTLTAGGTPLAGSRVVALDASGRAISAAAVLSVDGQAQLVLAPGTTTLWLRAGPAPEGPAAVNSAPPTPAFETLGPFEARETLAHDLPGLPAAASLEGEVRDVTGQAVANAHVYARSLDGAAWSIARGATTGGDGAFTLPLRAGRYLVQAVPDTDPTSPALSAEVEITLPATRLVLTCKPRVRASGRVLRPDLTALAGTQITATRLPTRLVSGRTAQVAPSDAAGAFELAGDPGDYRVELRPPGESGLPRRIVTLTLSEGGGGVGDLVLPRGLEAVGTLTGERTGAPTEVVAGATVEFFALDASGKNAISIGSAVSDGQGRYKALLPDVDPEDLSNSMR